MQSLWGSDTRFTYEELDYMRRIFSICHNQLMVNQDKIHVPDETWDYLVDLEERVIEALREKVVQ
jgi:hypothetical protein